jgi:hypothetical protein
MKRLDETEQYVVRGKQAAILEPEMRLQRHDEPSAPHSPKWDGGGIVHVDLSRHPITLSL